MEIKELVRIKAELLCWGLKYDKEVQNFFKRQNPNLVEKTGNIGLHILLEDKLPILVTTTHKFDQKTPYRLKQKNEIEFLEKEGKTICKISSIKMPEWYSKTTSNGTPMSSVFLHEGQNFLHQSYQGCGYFQINKPCKFCGTGAVWNIPKPDDIGQTVEAAYKENARYHVCLGGGTPLSPGKGTEYFLECIKEIRKRVKEIPIWVEMVPPNTNESLQLMINAGATSFGFNLETLDEALRKEICPGKSEVNVERYFEAFDYVTEKLGKNKVGTVLLAGLESKESTIKWAKILSQKNVKVCILPFKPWDDSRYANKEPCNPEDLLWIGKKVSKFMKLNNIDPRKNHGCLNCSSCTIEDDLRMLE